MMYKDFTFLGFKEGNKKLGFMAMTKKANFKKKEEQNDKP